MYGMVSFILVVAAFLAVVACILVIVAVVLVVVAGALMIAVHHQGQVHIGDGHHALKMVSRELKYF